MRDIKFKARRLDNGEWVEGFYVNCQYDDDKNKTGHFILEYPNTKHEIYTDTVCQYTGLKDKNGKEIWEGDRVLGDVGNGYNSAPRLLQRIGIVEYGNKTPGFSLKIINRFGVNENGESDCCDFQGCGVSFGAFGNMEVIGTKFDDCLYKKPDGLCLRESDSENNIYCVEGPCEELFSTKFDVEVESESKRV